MASKIQKRILIQLFLTIQLILVQFLQFAKYQSAFVVPTGCVIVKKKIRALITLSLKCYAQTKKT